MRVGARYVFFGFLAVDGLVEHRGPVEALACASHAVVPIASARNAVRQVGGVCGNFRGDNALAHVLYARQAQVLGGSHVAQEVGAVCCGDRAANG